MNWTEKIDWWRVARLAAAVIMSIFVGYEFQPMVANNPDAVNTVVTIFSILAGFLIAVITFIAEPSLQQAKNWGELQKMKKTVHRKLYRQTLLFFLYLLTLGLALAMYLAPAEMHGVQKLLQTLFLGLATFVFLASFTLPGSLMKIQMERYEALLKDSQPKVVTDAKDSAKSVQERQRRN